MRHVGNALRSRILSKRRGGQGCCGLISSVCLQYGHHHVTKAVARTRTEPNANRWLPRSQHRTRTAAATSQHPARRTWHHALHAALRTELVARPAAASRTASRAERRSARFASDARSTQSSHTSSHPRSDPGCHLSACCTHGTPERRARIPHRPRSMRLSAQRFELRYRTVPDRALVIVCPTCMPHTCSLAAVRGIPPHCWGACGRRAVRCAFQGKRWSR